MKKFVFVVLILISLISCNNPTPADTPAKDRDQVFNEFADKFLEEYLAQQPQNAVSLGYHEFDGKVGSYTKAAIDSQVSWLRSYEKQLADFDTSGLSTKMKFDHQLLTLAVKNDLFTLVDKKVYTTNPMSYAGAIDVNLYIKRDYAPIENRLRFVLETEKQIPVIFEAAMANLDDSLAKPYIETAIQIANGNAAFLKGDLLTAIKDVKNDSLMSQFKIVNDSAIAATKRFVNYLEKVKLPKAHNRYAIGRDNYIKMLQYGEGITFTPEQILEIGMRELKVEQESFNSAAKIINPNKKPVDVYRDVQKEHPVADSLIPTAIAKAESIRQFLIDKKIVTMPSEVRVKIKETPQYARATSTASMDVPGPFETKATEAYYYITPVEHNWTAKQKDDWLSMFGYYNTENVAIHEAYPGHYTQFLHLNASTATRVEKIFGSYAFIEGWAHYCERMMVEQGYGNTGDSIKAAKHRIAQSGDALLRICRLVVSIKTHCEGMTVDEATRFFMDNWYQGDKPSRQEAIRGTFDPGYLFYTLGKLQILKLQADYKKQEGTNYRLLDFHDKMLDNGMMPVRLLREILLKDKTTWNNIL